MKFHEVAKIREKESIERQRFHDTMEDYKERKRMIGPEPIKIPPPREQAEEIAKIVKKSVDFIKGGYGDGKPDSAFNKRQLQRGIKIEMEHTNDPRKAKEIAKDHLTEFPTYYTGLKRMERQLESMERIKPLLAKARRNLRGKLDMGVRRRLERRYPGFEYMAVMWKDKGRRIQGNFRRRKGTRRWYFDSMIS